MGWGQNVGLRDFCHILTLLPLKAAVFRKHMSSCKKFISTQFLLPTNISVRQNHLVILKLTKFFSIGASGSRQTQDDRGQHHGERVKSRDHRSSDARVDAREIIRGREKDKERNRVKDESKEKERREKSIKER